MRKTNPYANLPSPSFWRRAVSVVAPFELDPVLETSFRIAPEDKVATAGSCFAQHISRTLHGLGMNYFVPEASPPGMSEEQARASNYGVFSARFGNVYTTRQLIQLFQRAFDGAQPADGIWRRPDGRLVDAFRPTIEPDGFETEAELVASRDDHLAAVRRMCEELDIFVFTLGLTECWRSKIDGFAYPLAPGTAAGEYDPERYEFINLTVAEVESDLLAFCQRLRACNPRCRFLFTVSPVPLIATYRNAHVLVATTYSKSVLRVAAESVSRKLDRADYFPSYEIISSPYNQGAYFAEDLREINELGVGHVMRMFLRHYVDENTEASEQSGAASSEFEAAFKKGAAVVCDEEEIVR
jgi:hypothetical protein